MNPEIQKRTNRKSQNIIIASLTVFALLMLALAGQITYTILNNDRLYNGISISGHPVGKLDKSEAVELLKKNFQEKADGTQVLLKAGNKSETINFKDIGLTYNIQDAVDRAYKIGRTGSFVKRLSDILKSGRQGTELQVYPSYDIRKLEAAVKKLYDQTFINVKEVDVLIQENKVTVRSGHHGENIDRTVVTNEILKMINSGTGGELDIPIIITQPGKINLDELYSQINREPVDASAKVENNAVTVVPHIPGRHIEKSTLSAIVDNLQGHENTEAVLPVTYKDPEITTDKAKALLLKDTLYTMSSWFSTSTENDRNRAENIKLAVQKINGLILGPGDEFSFNKAVGPRTEAGGYQAAHTYVSGKVVDGIGGGICQVSSTLYNAALYSDMEIVERRNHMFTVGYVPYGQDATVSYGEIDFRFKNSFKWPVKLEAAISGNKVSFAIKGTREAPGKTIEITPKTVKTIDYQVKYIDDPTLPEGTTKIKQNGAKGYVIDTYKTVKQDGVVISNAKLYTSTYQPLDEEILKGTQKPGATAPAAKTGSTDPKQPAGIDDADNPPAPAQTAAPSAPAQ